MKWSFSPWRDRGLLVVKQFPTLQWSGSSVLAAICIGMAKAGFGGLGMLAILMMARVLPPRESTGAILPMLILADVFAISIYHQHARGGLVLKMIPPALVGIVCGWLLMPHIPSQQFGRLIGWLTVALVAFVLVQKLAPRLTSVAAEHPGIAWPFGWLAGSTTMIANAAGPVMTIYLLASRPSSNSLAPRRGSFSPSTCLRCLSALHWG